MKAKDNDDQELYYEWFVADGRVEGSGPSVIYYSQEFPAQPSRNVVVFITDGRGGWTVDQAVCTIP